jgi:hypothetical protein
LVAIRHFQVHNHVIFNIMVIEYSNSTLEFFCFAVVVYKYCIITLAFRIQSGMMKTIFNYITVSAMYHCTIIH